MGLGVGAIGTVATDLILATAPPERAGTASGISETGGELGGALGIAILGSIGAAVYRAQITEAIPDRLPGGAAEAAQDTLGGALGAADELPRTVVDAAGEAFVQGLQLAALTGAALMAAMAAVAALTLTRRRATT
jgi:DHA2 family multidrug resistance protein-like MFS transporter